MKRTLFLLVAIVSVAGMIAISGCTKDVEADFDCPASVVAGETFFVSNYSLNAYSYIWEFGDKSYVSSSSTYDAAIIAHSIAYSGEQAWSISESYVFGGGDSKEDYDYYVGRDPDPVYFKYAGEKKIILHAYSKNGKKSSHKVKYITVLENPNGSGGDNPSNPTTPDDPVASPTASFNINSSEGNYAPTTIQCYNTSTNAVTYKWTLTKPDYTSATSTLKNPSFTCSQAGTYTLELIAYNSNNVSSTKSQTITLVTPSTYTITYLNLQQIPMLASDNSSWDTGIFDGTAPDIFFNILDSNGTRLYTSSTKSNTAETSLPVTWNNVNLTLNYGSTYYIKFYDSDGGIDDNDLMASCIFNSSYLTPGSSYYIWNATSGTIKFTVGLTWS